MTSPVKYSDLLAVKVEPALCEAIEASAARHRVKVSELVRNLLWTAIALQGSDETPDVRADGKRKYSHLIDGALVDSVYLEPTQ